MLINTNYSIDSFKLWIPSEQVNIIDYRLGALKQTFYSQTGEIEKTEIQKTLSIENDIGTTYKWSQKAEAKTLTSYITVTIKSHILFKDYYKGISKQNIKQVYDYIISEKIIEFNYDTFLKSSITDVDFKTDFQITELEFKQLTKYLQLNTLRKKESYLTIYKQKHNKGIQYNERHTTKTTLSKPFLKIYSKSAQTELDTKTSNGLTMKAFKVKYLEDFCPPDLYRFEFTMKNKEFFKHYMKIDNTLENVINLNQEHMKQAGNTALNKYIKTADKNPTTAEATDKDVNFHLIIKYALKLNLSLQQIYQEYKHLSRSTQQRYKDKIELIYNDYFKDTKEAKVNEKLHQIFKQIGLF